MRLITAVGAFVIGAIFLIDTIQVAVQNRRDNRAIPNLIGGKSVFPTCIWFRVGRWTSPSISGYVYYYGQGAISIGLIAFGVITVVRKVFAA
jgi:hypothetical protein